MVRPALRSRSLRRVFRKAPGGRIVLHYKQTKPKAAHCRLCGAALKGVSRGLLVRTKNKSTSQKRPSRPFGGNLCSACTRVEMKKKARI